MFVLAIIGLIISGYLLFTYLTASPIICLNTGCEQVRSSPYAYLLKIPIPAYGALMYFGIVLLTLLRTMVSASLFIKATKLLFLLSAIGLLISAYLTYLEAFVIKAYCIWCVSSALVVFLIFLIASFELRRLNEIKE